MKHLRATREVYYASKTRNVGDEFEAEDGDARILVGIDKAVYVTAPIKAQEQKAKIQTAALKAEKPVEEKPKVEAMTSESAAEITIGQRRRYMRRDMQAKE